MNNIIITGAAGNLGKAITKRLLDDGNKIHATLGPKDDPGFIMHKNLKTHKVNLLEEQIAAQFVTDVIEENDSVDALICIVGSFAKGGIEETDGATIQNQIRLNFESGYFTLRPLIKKRKANQVPPLQVIFIGARPAIEPEQGQFFLAYALSKSLLFKLAEFINVNTNETGVSASVIVPTTLDTPGARAAMPNADTTKWVSTDRVADTVAFILSEAGMMMRQPIYKIYNKG